MSDSTISWVYTLIARFMGPTWGPSGADRTQVGPILAPWTLLSGQYMRLAYNERNWVHARTRKMLRPYMEHFSPGRLFTKRTNALPQDLMKPWSREIRIIWTFPIALKFDRHLGGSFADMPVKFRVDMIIITSNLAGSRLHEIWRCLLWTVLHH